jgi:hypothetical protein
MAYGDYNIGSDTTVTIVSQGPVGPIIASQILTEFEARQIASKLKSVAIDGVNRYRELEEGWEGTLNYDRADSVLDAYFAAKEANRYAGGAPPVVTITETTVNATDRSISIYRYDGVTMKFDSIGPRKGDSKVDEKVSWTSSRRIQVM